MTRRRHGWLALDPGITTGWALVEDGGKWVGAGNIDEADLEKRLDELIRTLHGGDYWLTVVVEDLPRVGGSGELGKRLRAVQETIGTVVVETYELPVKVVTPGQWKPSREAKTTKLPRKWFGKTMTQHQRDAIRIGVYADSRLERGEPPR